jgi:hypothetical protein
MEDTAGDRLFPLQGYGDDFVTGVCADGRQVVMGLLCPYLVAYFFAPDGRLLEDEDRLWERPARRMGGDGPYMIYDDDFQAALARQRKEWQAALGFQPCPIQVRAFLDGRHPVGIELLPDYLQEHEPADWEGEPDEEVRQDIEQSRATWLASGQFVWWWAKDYWMSADGEVEST